MSSGTVLPFGWTQLTIGAVSTIITGNTPPTSNRDLYGGTIPFVGPSDLCNQILTTQKNTLSQLARSVARIVPPNSVLVSCIGLLGKCALTSVETALNQQLNAVIFVVDVDPKFGFYQCQTLRPYLEGNASATTVPIVNKKKFSQAPFRVAPLNEQRRIVAKIDELFSDLDAGVAALERVQANLKRYRAAVLKSAVEGKLTAQWRKKNKPAETGEQLLARILKEHRKKWEDDQLAKFAAAGKSPPKGWQAKYKEPTPPDTTNLPKLPEGWCWASVEQVGQVQLGRQRSPKNRSDRYPTKYLRAANLTESGLDLSDLLEMEFLPKELETYRLEVGDILLSEASGSPDQVGKPVVWRGEINDCCFQNTVIRLQPINIETDFALTVFRHYYRSKLFARVSAGVGINHLSAAKFSAIPFPLPPIDEQIRIATEVEAMLSFITKVELLSHSSSRRTASLRQAILKHAFEGKLVPQDPADEPVDIQGNGPAQGGGAPESNSTGSTTRGRSRRA